MNANSTVRKTRGSPVAESVQNGCDRVLNLATGFDTRPYRLDLPAGTEWIEADLPEIINEKQRLLTGETARCRLSRVAVDLADTPSRSAFLADATSGARDALVITEGLLLYLGAAGMRTRRRSAPRRKSRVDH
jgi:O-methyltransferase involved in polyketide biosynthesis